MRTLTLATALLLALTAHAQTADSIRTELTTEPDSVRPKPTRLFAAMYRRFVRAQIEEKTLIKIGAVPTYISHYHNGDTGGGFVSEITIEQKLIPTVSVLLSANTYYRRESSYFEQTQVKGLIAGRWYYDMNRRIATGKGANNFSSQYLTAIASLPIWTRTRCDNNRPDCFEGPLPKWVGLAWGAQRRLGKLAYIDFYAGVKYQFDANERMVKQFTGRTPPATIFFTSFLVGLGL